MSARNPDSGPHSFSASTLSMELFPQLPVTSSQVSSSHSRQWVYQSHVPFCLSWHWSSISTSSMHSTNWESWKLESTFLNFFWKVPPTSHMVWKCDLRIGHWKINSSGQVEQIWLKYFECVLVTFQKMSLFWGYELRKFESKTCTLPDIQTSSEGFF